MFAWQGRRSFKNSGAVKDTVFTHFQYGAAFGWIENCQFHVTIEVWGGDIFLQNASLVGMDGERKRCGS